ncbi:hypothetical protein ACJX0J_017724, partial [Zea mays]
EFSIIRWTGNIIHWHSRFSFTSFDVCGVVQNILSARAVIALRIRILHIFSLVYPPLLCPMALLSMSYLATFPTKYFNQELTEELIQHGTFLHQWWKMKITVDPKPQN